VRGLVLIGFRCRWFRGLGARTSGSLKKERREKTQWRPITGCVRFSCRRASAHLFRLVDSLRHELAVIALVEAAANTLGQLRVRRAVDPLPLVLRRSLWCLCARHTDTRRSWDGTGTGSSVRAKSAITWPRAWRPVAGGAGHTASPLSHLSCAAACASTAASTPLDTPGMGLVIRTRLPWSFSPRMRAWQNFLSLSLKKMPGGLSCFWYLVLATAAAAGASAAAITVCRANYSVGCDEDT
jgi:hypothetical protein